MEGTFTVDYNNIMKTVLIRCKATYVPFPSCVMADTTAEI